MSRDKTPIAVIAGACFFMLHGCDNASEDGGSSTDPDTGSATVADSMDDTTSDSVSIEDTNTADTGEPGAGLVDFLGDPDYPDDFWETATPAEAGMDPAPLQQAVDAINAEGWEIHSFVIARNGRLVLEQYGYNTGTTSGDLQSPHQTVVAPEN